MKAAKFRYLFQFSPWAALVHPLPPRWTTLLRPVAPAALSTVADDNHVGRSVGRGGAPFAALCFNPGAGPLWMCSIQNLQKIKFCQPTTATATRSRPDGTGPAAFVGCCQHLAFGFAWHRMVLFSRDVESRVRLRFRLDCNEWIMENEVDYWLLTNGELCCPLIYLFQLFDHYFLYKSTKFLDPKSNHHRVPEINP